MSARFLVTVSQYQGVFVSAIAHRPGPNLKSGSQTIGKDAENLHTFERYKEVAIPQHRRIELALIESLARHFVEPEQTVGFGSTHPLKLCLRGREVAAQQGDRIDDGMQVDNHFAAYPIDVVTTFAAQCPRPSPRACAGLSPRRCPCQSRCRHSGKMHTACCRR